MTVTNWLCSNSSFAAFEGWSSLIQGIVTKIWRLQHTIIYTIDALHCSLDASVSHCQESCSHRILPHNPGVWCHCDKCLRAISFHEVLVLRKELVGIDLLKSINDVWNLIVVFTYCLGASVLEIVQKVVTICPRRYVHWKLVILISWAMKLAAHFWDDWHDLIFWYHLHWMDLYLLAMCSSDFFCHPWQSCALARTQPKEVGDHDPLYHWHMVIFFRALRYFNTIVVLSGSVRWLFIHCPSFLTTSCYYVVRALFWHSIMCSVVLSGCGQHGYLAPFFSWEIWFRKWFTPINFTRILEYETLTVCGHKTMTRSNASQ